MIRSAALVFSMAVVGCAADTDVDSMDLSGAWSASATAISTSTFDVSLAQSGGMLTGSGIIYFQSGSTDSFTVRGALTDDGSVGLTFVAEQDNISFRGEYTAPNRMHGVLDGSAWRSVTVDFYR
jgi:hypothetical protein